MTPLFLPVEFLNREIDFKLVLAAKLAMEGPFRSYLGVADALWAAIDTSEGGIYLGKDVFRPYFTDDVGAYRRLKRNGHRLVHLDEEGAVYMGGPDDWQNQLLRRLDPSRLDAGDVICTWGEFQREVYQSRMRVSGARVVATGHPRLDLAKEPYQFMCESSVEDVRRRVGGEFVLFVGNFPRVNHALGAEYIFSKYYNYNAADEDSRLAFVGRWAHFSQIFAQFIKAAHVVASSNPTMKLVVRPHPSEDVAFYRACFGGVPNVIVDGSGSALPWLRAARAVVHNGCTTAIEASLAGTPVITFRPVCDERYDKVLPNATGLTVNSVDELVESVAAGVALRRGPTGESTATVARQMIENFQSESFLRMCEVVRGTDQGGGHDAPRHVARRALLEAAFEAAKDVPRRVMPSRRAMRARVRKKFPGFEPKDIARRLDRIRVGLGVQMTASFLSSRLIMLEVR